MELTMPTPGRIPVTVYTMAVAQLLAGLGNAQPSCRIEGQQVSNGDLREASGVAVGRRTSGVLWSHNDSGDPVLIALGADGATRGRVWVAGAAVEDWEDIEVAPCPG